MKITTNFKGQIAASKTELRAIELGLIPSRPVFDTRYDLILDDTKTLKKVQIKYADGKLSNSVGSVMVKLGYQDRRKNKYYYEEGEIDALIVYIPKLDKLCYIPPSLFVGKDRITIRYVESKNKQNQGIIYARDYLW